MIALIISIEHLRHECVHCGSVLGIDGCPFAALYLFRYLFPEGSMLAKEGAALADMESALQNCIVSSECRRAALDLVVELMTSSSVNMEEGLDVLFDIHFRTGPMLPDRRCASFCWLVEMFLESSLRVIAAIHNWYAGQQRTH